MKPYQLEMPLEGSRLTKVEIEFLADMQKLKLKLMKEIKK